MKKHGLQPAAFRFPVKLTDEADFIGDGWYSDQNSSLRNLI